MEVLSTAARRPSGRARRRPAVVRLLLLIGLLARGPGLSAQTPAAGEYNIKAIFVLHFAHFVRWPPEAFPDPQAPFIIGVLGADPFGAALDDAVRGEKIGDHPLRVQRYRRVQDIAACHILFISQSEGGRLGGILASLKNRSILTVGDVNGFDRRGGMISFFTENQKIRLKINVEAARAAALTIDSRLLRPAKIVETGAN